VDFARDLARIDATGGLLFAQLSARVSQTIEGSRRQQPQLIDCAEGIVLHARSVQVELPNLTREVVAYVNLFTAAERTPYPTIPLKPGLNPPILLFHGGGQQLLAVFSHSWLGSHGRTQVGTLELVKDDSLEWFVCSSGGRDAHHVRVLTSSTGIFAVLRDETRRNVVQLCQNYVQGAISTI
jgi:hypothetical protein